jgi:hypothetical protein
VALRSDILRGVRLFLIAFAAILLGYLAYQMVRPTAEAQGDQQDTTHAAESQPAAAPGASSPADSPTEPHPLVVPPPPAVPGATPNRAIPVKVARKADAIVPPPPPLRASQPTKTNQALTGREFETPGVTPVPIVKSTEETPQANPVPSKAAVGYKSLLEANPNRPPAQPIQAENAPEEPRKAEGNRLVRGLGRLFGAKPKP